MGTQEGQVHTGGGYSGAHEVWVGPEVGRRCVCMARMHLGRCTQGACEHMGGTQVHTEGG